MAEFFTILEKILLFEMAQMEGVVVVQMQGAMVQMEGAVDLERFVAFIEGTVDM